MKYNQVLITGGAGFIGINAAEYFINKGAKVTILDNFSRYGSKINVSKLKEKIKDKLKIIETDIRENSGILNKTVKNSQLILHLAGQVAVTTSVINPREDFEINVVGTINLLEAIRKSGNNPILIYSSTNKVYGNLENTNIVEKKNRYEFKDFPYGISEKQDLDFHSPYGCSKGAADQYIHDYSRVYKLNTIVFRQSCIYGPHQFGIEDQGWVAWFIIALLKKEKIKIYGNGKQVRDILYIDDLLKAYELATDNINITKGNVYNIGGSYKNKISIWYEFKPILENLFSKKINAKFLPERIGDQKIFIADVRKSKKDFGWEPQVSYVEGINNLYKWIIANKELFIK